ncbi:uncharacterized protein [Gossypium hirsutum]|uniref:Uncharacterized protein isoform X1 n=2 Tax=Gossypium hirsutum TaxID=3635 RepID=A0ABM3BMG2_GOSHI|nr:uncharacterized protein LOC107925534 isoform X1 [Gossypium hirsutum]XP_040968219.1 uncharacterized protein LOC107925534 isoform X1 [Gossypium hirsutum]
MLDRMGNGMDATRGIMSGTMDRFKKVFEKKSNRKIMGMDLGVGSFVLMNAVTSRQARNIKSSMSWWKAAFKSATPLLLLGFARLASTLNLDYQVEYISLRWTFCNNSCLQWNRISCVLYLLANIKQMELWEMSKIMLQTSLYSKAFCIIRF